MAGRARKEEAERPAVGKCYLSGIELHRVGVLKSQNACAITYGVAQSLSVRSQREVDLALAVLKAVRHCEQQMALWDYTLRVSIKARKHVTIRPEFQFGEPLNISPVD